MLDVMLRGCIEPAEVWDDDFTRCILYNYRIVLKYILLYE